MNNNLKKILTCEICGNKNLICALNLGLHPLCDDLVPLGSSRKCREYPIQIVYCSTCCTAHQKYQVAQKTLFPRTYNYRSRFTQDVLKGMQELIQRCEKSMSVLVGRRVLDVGCNDGSLLSFFREKGAITIGIEPTDACKDAEKKGHITFNSFLTYPLAKKVVHKHGKPDLIIFTNVFAHIEKLSELLKSLKCLISKKTLLVIENHYLGSVLKKHQFDTFYHEHPRTYSCTSFLYIAELLGLKVKEVEFPQRYGGNIRVFFELGKCDTYKNKKKLLQKEKNYGDLFKNLNQNIKKWKKNKTNEILALFQKNGKLRAKAFPGRAAILIKLLGLNENLIEAIYEKPGSLKIGKYVPGTRIPILSDNDLWNLQDKNRPIINMAWHISDEIHEYLSNAGYTGPVIDILTQKDFC